MIKGLLKFVFSTIGLITSGWAFRCHILSRITATGSEIKEFAEVGWVLAIIMFTSISLGFLFDGKNPEKPEVEYED